MTSSPLQLVADLSRLQALDGAAAILALSQNGYGRGGTLRTHKAVPHLGVDENVKIGTKLLGRHQNSTRPNENCSKFGCESNRDDGNAP